MLGSKLQQAQAEREKASKLVMLKEEERLALQAQLKAEKEKETSQPTMALRSIGDSENFEHELIEERVKSKALQKENKELASDKAALGNKLIDVESELKRVQADMSSQQKEIETLKCAMELSQRQCMGLELELTASKIQLDETSALQENLQSELALFRESVSRLESEKEHISKTSSASILAVKAENSNLIEQLDSANATIVQLERKCSALATQIDEDKSSSKNASVEASELVKKNNELEAALADMTEKNELQEKKIKKLAKLVKRSIAAAKKTSSTKPNDVVPREIIVEDDDNEEDFHRAIESGSRGSVKTSVKTATDGDNDNENHVGIANRVSRMKMEVNLQYHDKVTNEMKSKTVHAEYTGPVVDSKPNGAGMLKFACGDMYLGMFEDGMMSGTGSYVRNKKRRHHKEKKGSKVPKHITTTSDDADNDNNKKEQQPKRHSPALTKKRSYFKGLFNRNEFVHEDVGTK